MAAKISVILLKIVCFRDSSRAPLSSTRAGTTALAIIGIALTLPQDVHGWTTAKKRLYAAFSTLQRALLRREGVKALRVLRARGRIDHDEPLEPSALLPISSVILTFKRLPFDAN